MIQTYKITNLENAYESLLSLFIEFELQYQK